MPVSSYQNINGKKKQQQKTNINNISESNSGKRMCSDVKTDTLFLKIKLWFLLVIKIKLVKIVCTLILYSPLQTLGRSLVEACAYSRDFQLGCTIGTPFPRPCFHSQPAESSNSLTAPPPPSCLLKEKIFFAHCFLIL